MKSIPKLFLALLALMAGMTNLMAKDQYSRVIKKEYPVNPDAQLVISNKYGKLHLTNWEKPVISVEVVLSTDASSEQAAQKMLDQITVTMNSSPSLVELKSSFDGGSSGRIKFNIDFNIVLPSSINLDLTNKFGDISIDRVKGKSNINLSYGDLDVNKLENSENLLDVKFGKINVKSIKGAVIVMKYSGLELDYAGSLRIDSKFSDITADKIISLNSNMEGGKVEIKNSTALDIKSKFTDLDVTRIENSLALNIQYGNCEVQEMVSGFSTISIVNKYADVSIGIPDDASYRLDADLKFCDLDFPEDKANFTQKISGETSKSYKATVGRDSNPSSKVTINSEFGNISLE